MEKTGFTNEIIQTETLYPIHIAQLLYWESNLPVGSNRAGQYIQRPIWTIGPHRTWIYSVVCYSSFITSISRRAKFTPGNVVCFLKVIVCLYRTWDRIGNSKGAIISTVTWFWQCGIVGTHSSSWTFITIGRTVGALYGDKLSSWTSQLIWCSCK